MLTALKKIYRRVKRPPVHRAEINLAYDVLGSDYGGWPLLKDYTADGVLIYSFGIGEDLTFDLAAVDRYGAVVHAFDPTPRSLNWIGLQTLPANIIFHPIGIADVDGEAKFFAPAKDQNVSFSASPAKGSDAALAVTAPVKQLGTIVSELGTGAPDVLKMDIEGFEYDVLAQIIEAGFRPAQLLIEFHHRMYDIPTSKTQAIVEDLRAVGYKVFYVSESGHEYGLVHTGILPH